MNQAELFAEPPASATVKDSLPVEMPSHYLDLHGMSIVQKPVLMWLVDAIVEVLTEGPVLSRELWDRVGLPVSPFTLSRHLGLAIDLGLVCTDYRFDEPRNAGCSDPAVVYLPETGVRNG